MTFRDRAGCEMLVFTPPLPLTGLGAVSLFTLGKDCEFHAPDRRNTMLSGRLADIGKWQLVAPKIYHSACSVHEISAD